jgi:hypothetical protein
MALELKPSRAMTLVALLASSLGVNASLVSREIHRTFAVSTAEPVSLLVELREGDLRIAYAREGEVSISAVPQDASNIDLESLATRVAITQAGNRVEIRERRGSDNQSLKLTYTIDVPYRTEIRSSVQHGNQTMTGVMGPVSAKGGSGDIEVTYISLGVVASAQTGNVSCEVVGGRIEVRTGAGNIECRRALQGIDAETGSGEIALAVVGSSVAVVRGGVGRIDIAGARGPLFASTSAGDLHVKAVPHEDWQLSSSSGTIRIELPPGAGFDLDAATGFGDVVIRREDLKKPDAEFRRITQRANAGGKRIEIRSDDGDIVIE